MWRILCVEDDENVARNLTEYFQEWVDDNPYGAFGVVIERDFRAAIGRLENEHFDLVTLDLHGAGDPDPMRDTLEDDNQIGIRVLNSLRATRFVPVIFYTGFAQRIADIETGIVRVVRKGQNDLQAIRDAAKHIYSTGLPSLIRKIDEEKRIFMWNTVDAHWEKISEGGTPEDLAYLLARRLAAKLSRESVKEQLGHAIEAARPIETYIYPPIDEKIKTGCIIKDEGGAYWIVVTPACDFARANADRVILVGATQLSEDQRFIAWHVGPRWKGAGAAPDKGDQATWNKLYNLLKNNGGERWRFFPGTFFLPDLVVDLQNLKQIPIAELAAAEVICRIDSPYREELSSNISRYYGRVGTPDLDTAVIVARI